MEPGLGRRSRSESSHERDLPLPAGRTPLAVTRRQAVEAGGPIEPLLPSLFAAARAHLNELAGSPAEGQIAHAIGSIQFEISKTLFNAQTPPGQPPAGEYYRDAISSCWDYLVGRCNQEGMSNVARSIEAYDRAGMEFVYQTVRDELESLAHPKDMLKEQQALSSLAEQIALATGRARLPKPVGETELKTYWQYLLKRCGKATTLAIAARLASQDSAVRGVAEGAKWFQRDFPATSEASKAFAGTGSHLDGKPIYGSVGSLTAKMWLDFMNSLAWGNSRCPE